MASNPGFPGKGSFCVIVTKPWAQQSVTLRRRGMRRTPPTHGRHKNITPCTGRTKPLDPVLVAETFLSSRPGWRNPRILVYGVPATTNAEVVPS